MDDKIMIMSNTGYVMGPDRSEDVLILQLCKFFSHYP